MAKQGPQPVSTICACGSPLPIDPDTSPPLDYRYQRLSPPTSFRVLSLLPGVGADPVCGAIQERSPTDNDAKSPFNALSYTWLQFDFASDSDSALSSAGNPFAWENVKKPHAIIIDDVSKMNVTCSVYSALTRIRSPSQQIHLFIDAICIDQGSSVDSLKERAVQVSLMGNIYSKADTVLADLGDNDDGATDAVKYMRAFAEIEDKIWKRATESPEAFVALVPARLIEGLTPEAWCSFVALCTRKWWRRIWILQEILLARKAIFYINRETIDRETLMKGLTRLWSFHNYNDVIAATRGVAKLEVQLRAQIYADCWLPCVSFAGILGWKQHEPGRFLNGMELIQIMALTDTFNSTVPHDQIYALLGLGTQAERDDILVDYSLPYKTVLVDFCRYAIRSGHLAILFHQIEWAESNSDLPSWTLEPMRKNKRDALNQSVFYGDTFETFNASGGAAPQIAFDKTGMLLSIDGIHLGSLDDITDSPYPLTGYQTWKNISEWFVDARRVFLSHSPRKGQSALDDFWSTLCAGRRLRLPATGADIEKLSTSAHVFNDALEERTLPYPAQGREKEWRQYYNYTNAICQGRRFGITEEGRLALVPGRARVGDRIAVLLGGRLPFVIRPTTQGMFYLIGSAFVLGFMDGEALQLDDRHRESIVLE